MHLLRYILLLTIVFSFQRSSAQSEKVMNTPYIDQRRFHFGFMLGVHTQDLAFTHSGNIAEDGEWYAEIPSFSPGFAVGLVSDMALTESLSLRFTPSMYFGNRYVKFRNVETNERISQDIKSNYIALPVNMKYSARRLNNYRPYIICGMSAMFDLSKKKDTPIVLKRSDLCLEIGLGCDFYLPYFKFIPELKFSFGLLDMIQHKRNDLRDPTMIKYTDAISEAKNRFVVLSFYFE